MTKQEILEFLELPGTARDRDIVQRLQEKLNYFRLLSENAPNEFLRKLHQENTRKVLAIQEQFGGSSATDNITAPPARPIAPPPATGAAPAHQKSSPRSGNACVGWLIRHTENMPTRKIPLVPGRNIIGRSAQAGATILIEDDLYVSRAHAVIEMPALASVRTAIIYDAGVLGKASKNGVYLNGDVNRISSRTELKEGDTVQIGYSKFNFRFNTEQIDSIIQQVEDSEYVKTVVIDIHH